MGLDLDQARRQAKELVRAARRGDADALARLRADRPPRLADAQAAVARELGFRSWPALLRGLLGAAVEDGDAERLRGEQLLRWASAGDDEVVTALLDAGVPIEYRGQHDGTALHYAALWGRSDTVRELLARGADVAALAQPPDQPGAQDWTTLDWAGWGSQHTTAASDRHAAYRQCATSLLEAGATMTGRTPIAHLIDEIKDSGLEYTPGSPVRIRVRVRGARVDVDDMGGAIAACGTPPGWHEAAERAVAEFGWNVRRNGVVCMQAPRARRLTWIIDRTAHASVALCDTILQLGGDAASR
jgi:hypothetical protein